MRYFVTFPGKGEIPVDVDLAPTGAIQVSVDGRRVAVEALLHEGSTTLSVGGQIVDLWMENGGPEVGVVARGLRFYARVESERMRALAAALGGKHAASGEGVVTSPMPGRVLKVLVEEGQVLLRGAALVVVEAMKMENELVATRDGTVKKIHVAAGQTVEGGAKLVEIE